MNTLFTTFGGLLMSGSEERKCCATGGCLGRKRDTSLRPVFGATCVAGSVRVLPSIVAGGDSDK